MNRREPYPWCAEEVRLIEDVAARLWDTLERARAEEELRQVNASLERQVETRTHERDRIWRVAPVLMVVGDAKGVLLEANPAWSRVLGWSVEETIGHDVMEFVAPEDRDAGRTGMAQLFAGQSVVEYQLTFLSKAATAGRSPGLRFPKAIASMATGATSQARWSRRKGCGNRRRWRRWGNSPAAWRMISTTY